MLCNVSRFKNQKVTKSQWCSSPNLNYNFFHSMDFKIIYRDDFLHCELSVACVPFCLLSSCGPNSSFLYLGVWNFSFFNCICYHQLFTNKAVLHSCNKLFFPLLLHPWCVHVWILLNHTLALDEWDIKSLLIYRLSNFSRSKWCYNGQWKSKSSFHWGLESKSHKLKIGNWNYRLI